MHLSPSMATGGNQLMATASSRPPYHVEQSGPESAATDRFVNEDVFEESEALSRMEIILREIQIGPCHLATILLDGESESSARAGRS